MPTNSSTRSERENAGSWTLIGLGGLFLDIVDAIEATGGRVERVVLNQTVSDDALSIVPESIAIDRMPGLVGFEPSTAHHGFGFADPAKEELLALLQNRRLTFGPIIHPTAWVSPRSRVDQGVFIGAQAAIAANTVVGEFSLVNRCASVGHDSVLGAYTRLHPNAVVAGRCEIGRRVVVGAGATVIDHVRISDDVIVGAGATVVRNLDRPGTYVGVPARLAGFSNTRQGR